MQMKYTINLVDAYTEEFGDVATKDGEVIGTWVLIHGALYGFIPPDAEVPLFVDPFVWALCNQISDWFEQQDSIGHSDA